MISRLFLATLSILGANLLAQSPPPSSPLPAQPVKSSPITASSPAVPSAAPGKPTMRQLVDSLSLADLQAAMTLVKRNFTNPDEVTDTELNRATVEGLLVRLPRGVMLLPGKEAAPAEAPSALYGEVLEGHIGYLRLGSLNGANLQALDKSLGNFATQKVDALILDLRSSQGNDFAMAADFAKRFCPKGKPLFTLRKPATRPDRVLGSDRDPAFQGLMMVLADGDTSGGAEALASAVRFYDKALVIGQPTAGRAAEYSDLPLPGGKILRVAVTEAVSPEGRSLFADGVRPDVPVEMPLADKRQIFKSSADKGMAPFVYETGRPHMNEAALLAGTNPEVEAQQRRGRGAEKPPPHDVVLQRALDVVTSLEVYQKR